MEKIIDLEVSLEKSFSNNDLEKAFFEIFGVNKLNDLKLNISDRNTMIWDQSEPVDFTVDYK